MHFRKLRCFVANLNIVGFTRFVLIFLAKKCTSANLYAFCMPGHVELFILTKANQWAVSDHVTNFVQIFRFCPAILLGRAKPSIMGAIKQGHYSPISTTSHYITLH